MPNDREKSIWNEIDKITLVFAIIAIPISFVIYYFLNTVDLIEGSLFFVLRTLVLDVIANLIPVLLLFVVSYLLLRRIQILRSEHEVESLASAITAKIRDGLEIKQERQINLLSTRRKMTDTYEASTKKAIEIDIISLSMDLFLNHYSKEALREWIFQNGKEIRVLVLSPDADTTNIRGCQEGIDLRGKILNSLNELQKRFKEIEEYLQKNGGQCRGSFEVRIHSTIPYFAYFRADEEIIIGFYYSHLDGLHSECIQLNEQLPMHGKMREHFENLWNGKTENVSVGRRTICKISRSDLHFTEYEKLNEIEVNK